MSDVNADAGGVQQDAMRQLLTNNRQWAERMTRDDPEFFQRLTKQQRPEYLWIGCSDSRVPANQIMGLAPGEVFVHRNVANVVSLTDFNCLAVLQYAVEVLQVKHIIVTGHYGCGGVIAAYDGNAPGLVDHWLENVRHVCRQHEKELALNPDREAVLNRLCELNVRAQVINVAQTRIVQKAWARGQELTIHALIYSVSDGLIRELGLHISGPEHVPST